MVDPATRLCGLILFSLRRLGLAQVLHCAGTEGLCGCRVASAWRKSCSVQALKACVAGGVSYFVLVILVFYLAMKAL